MRNPVTSDPRSRAMWNDVDLDVIVISQHRLRPVYSPDADEVRLDAVNAGSLAKFVGVVGDISSGAPVVNLVEQYVNELGSRSHRNSIRASVMTSVRRLQEATWVEERSSVPPCRIERNQ